MLAGLVRQNLNRPNAAVSVTQGLSAPEVLDAVATGEHPTTLSSDHLIETSLPTIWTDQRNAFTAL
ncbi:MAG: hypothetical protein P8X66_09555 [Maritimibacter sp.]